MATLNSVFVAVVYALDFCSLNHPVGPLRQPWLNFYVNERTTNTLTTFPFGETEETPALRFDSFLSRHTQALCFSSDVMKTVVYTYRALSLCI